MTQHPSTRIAVSAFAVLALMLLTGCSDSREAVAEDMVDIMDELCDVLDGVKDEASASSAASEIEDLAEDMQDIQKRMKELGEPSKEEDAALEKEYGESMKATMGRFMKSMTRIQADPKLREPLNAALEKIGKSMRGK